MKLDRLAQLAALALLASCGRIGFEPTPKIHSFGNAGRDAGTPLDGGGGASGGAGAVGSGATSTGNGGAVEGAAGRGGAGAGGVETGGTSGGGRAGSTTSDGSVGDASGTRGSGGSADSGQITGSGGAGGAGVIGCADREREGFLDLRAYPDIAACDGGFSVPGTVGLKGPACARAGGDDGANPDGTGCNVEDLCEPGFHVCTDAVEVGAKTSTGCTGAVAGTASLFYLTRQSGTGQQKCGAGTDDVFGCGNIGFRAGAGCAPLDSASGNLCGALIAPWTCGMNQTEEALNVAKPGSSAGGVLCCRD